MKIACWLSAHVSALAIILGGTAVVHAVVLFFYDGTIAQDVYREFLLGSALSLVNILVLYGIVKGILEKKIHPLVMLLLFTLKCALFFLAIALLSLVEHQLYVLMVYLSFVPAAAYAGTRRG
jgi:hypothetical protein